MKFDLSSLRKYVKIKITATELAEILTNAGLEVESIVGEVLDVAIPPNRADCLGFRGLAREVAALTGELFDEPVIEPAAEGITDTIDLHVTDPSACPKYLGRIIKGVNNNIETPKWICDALTVADIKCISPIVDITNYVMLEWGQPLHAFTQDRVSGSITVRSAISGEKINLLDGS